MTTATAATGIVDAGASVGPEGSATRTVIGTFGVIVAMAGLEHGIGEIRQGSVAPPSLVFESWPDTPAFAILNGEPAMTVVPNLLVAGALTVVVSVAFAAWSVRFVRGPRGAVGLAVLSGLLLLAGGGLAPPLVGVVLAATASRIGRPGGPPGVITRRLAPAWRVALGAGVGGYLALFPGMVLGSAAFGVESELAVMACGLLAFGGLFMALAAGRAHDRVRAHAGGPVA